MMKAIFARDVRVGDVVSVNAYSRPFSRRGPFAVRRVVVENGITNRFGVRPCVGVSLYGEGKLEHTVLLDTIVDLVHRPWPEGKTEADMQWAVIVCSQKVEHTRKMEQLKRDFTLLGEAIVQLREAIDAYELGKPFDSAIFDHDTCLRDQIAD